MDFVILAHVWFPCYLYTISKIPPSPSSYTNLLLWLGGCFFVCFFTIQAIKGACPVLLLLLFAFVFTVSIVLVFITHVIIVYASSPYLHIYIYKLKQLITFNMPSLKWCFIRNVPISDIFICGKSSSSHRLGNLQNPNSWREIAQ